MGHFLVLLVPSIVSVIFFILWKTVAEKFFIYGKSEEAINMLITMVVFIVTAIIMTNII
jgi:hypothetical protein